MAPALFPQFGSHFIANSQLSAYAAALGSAGLVNRMVAGMTLPLGVSQQRKAELVARAIQNYKSLLEGGGSSARLRGKLAEVLEQVKVPAAGTFTERDARLVGSLEAELLFERRANLVKFMKSEGASHKHLLAEIARWQEDAELLNNPLYRGGVVEPPAPGGPPPLPQSMTPTTVPGFVMAEVFFNTSGTTQGTPRPVSNSIAARHFRGAIDARDTGDESIHIFSLEAAEVAWSDRFPPYVPLVTGGRLAFNRSIDFNDIVDALPSPGATVYDEYWQVVDHLMFGDLAEDNMPARRQRYAEIRRGFNSWLENNLNEENLLDRALKLVRAVEAVTAEQGIGGLVKVIEKTVWNRNFPLDPVLRDRFVKALRDVEKVITARPDLRHDEAVELLKTVPEELGLRRKLTTFPPFDRLIATEGGVVAPVFDAAGQVLYNQGELDAAVAAARQGLFTQADVDAQVAAARQGLFTQADVDAAVAAARQGLFTQADVDAAVAAASQDGVSRAEYDALLGRYNRADDRANRAETQLADALDG